ERLLEHLREAVDAGRIPRDRVFALLQDHEENGSQSILYYSPITEAVRERCRDGEGVAQSLFGPDWREEQGFPRLIRLESAYVTVDFRVGLPDKPNDWLMKLYSFQENRVRVRELQPGEAPAQLSLGTNEVAVVYERRPVESVLLARWNDHEQFGLLEIRVEFAGRRERFELDQNAVWTRLKEAFSREEDFVPWNLEPVLTRMLQECEDHAAVYRLGLTHLRDSGEGTVRYVPYTEHEPIDATPIRIQTIQQILNDGGTCLGLVMNWLPDESD